MLVLYNSTSFQPINKTIPQAMRDITSTTNISSLPTLKITMTIQTQAKPKRNTKYRPVERPDGVVVLQRPYHHPAALPAPNAPKFEKHIPTFAAPKSPTRPTQENAIKRIKEDLPHIGGSFVDAGRDGYNELMQAGRGGYQEISEQAKGLMEFLEGFGGNETTRHMTPMQRFLDAAGPWSTHELRQD